MSSRNCYWLHGKAQVQNHLVVSNDVTITFNINVHWPILNKTLLLQINLFPGEVVYITVYICTCKFVFLFLCSYTENMRKISAIFHDRPQRPVERASYWIEHVIKYGGDYMRTSGNYGHLSFIQTYLIDIMLLTVLIFVTIAIVSIYFTKLLLQIIRTLSSTRSDKTKTQWYIFLWEWCTAAKWRTELDTQK